MAQAIETALCYRACLWALLEFKRSIAEGGPFERLQTGIWIDWIVLQLLELERQADRCSEQDISGK